MKLAHEVEAKKKKKKKKKYNEAMRKRAQVNQSAGKEPKNYYTPQARYGKLTKNIDRVSEPFTPSKPWTNKIPTPINAVPIDYHLVRNSGGIEIRR